MSRGFGQSQLSTKMNLQNLELMPNWYLKIEIFVAMSVVSDAGAIVGLQLEKMHENHAQFEEEFRRRRRETAQVVSQHQELLQCLSEESEAKNQLALELHKAEGEKWIAGSFTHSLFLPAFGMCFLFPAFLGL